jgi:hypothetical protein
MTNDTLFCRWTRRSLEQRTRMRRRWRGRERPQTPLMETPNQKTRKIRYLHLHLFSVAGPGCLSRILIFIHPGSHNSYKREGGFSLVAIFSSLVECAFIRFSTNPLRLFFACRQSSIAQYGVHPLPGTSLLLKLHLL